MSTCESRNVKFHLEYLTLHLHSFIFFVSCRFDLVYGFIQGQPKDILRTFSEHCVMVPWSFLSSYGENTVTLQLVTVISQLNQCVNIYGQYADYFWKSNLLTVQFVSSYKDCRNDSVKIGSKSIKVAIKSLKLVKHFH